MITTLYIIRHGQTNNNITNLWIGQTDVLMNDFGRSQARGLSKLFSKTHIDVILSSPLKRALETGRIVAKGHKETDFIIVPAFIEIDCGKATGLLENEARKKFPKIFGQWAKNLDPRMPGGESNEDIEKRAIPALNRFLRTYQGKTILISGHAMLNKNLIGHFMGTPYGKRFRLRQANACVNEITIDDNIHDSDKIKVKKINWRPEF